jgi:hypothetical protein
MSDLDDGNAFLMEGGGTRWAKFPVLGSEVRGRVLSKPERRQRLDFVTKEPMTWPNGDPQMEVVFLLATSERNPEYDEDDGTRALHAYGQMKTAIQEAVRATQATGVFPGGELYVKWTHEEPSKSGGKPAKQYVARYTPPVSDGNADLMGEPQAAPATITTPDAIPPCPPNVEPAKWAAMSPDQRTIVQAALAAQGPAAQAAPQGSAHASAAPY